MIFLERKSKQERARRRPLCYSEGKFCIGNFVNIGNIRYQQDNIMWRSFEKRLSNTRDKCWCSFPESSYYSESSFDSSSQQKWWKVQFKATSSGQITCKETKIKYPALVRDLGVLCILRWRDCELTEHHLNTASLAPDNIYECFLQYNCSCWSVLHFYCVKEVFGLMEMIQSGCVWHTDPGKFYSMSESMMTSVLESRSILYL